LTRFFFLVLSSPTRKHQKPSVACLAGRFLVGSAPAIPKKHIVTHRVEVELRHASPLAFWPLFDAPWSRRRCRCYSHQYQPHCWQFGTDARPPHSCSRSPPIQTPPTPVRPASTMASPRSAASFSISSRRPTLSAAGSRLDFSSVRFSALSLPLPSFSLGFICLVLLWLDVFGCGIGADSAVICFC
jgi:hypothetical protein